MESYFIFLNKPVGITSQQLLNRFKRRLPKGTKVGHHGTLDPFAEGLMLVAVGEACKFISYVDDSRKTYVATLRLGMETETGDLTGRVTATKPPLVKVTKQNLIDVFQSFYGVTEQIPPMYSAVKIDGVPLYKKARAGEIVERKPRKIEIFDLQLLDYVLDVEKQFIKFEVVCSRGTYIRTLAEDIARKLGTVGHLVQLTRIHLCGLKGDGAILNLSDYEPEESRISENLVDHFIPIQNLLRHHLRVDVNDDEKIRLYQGKTIEKFSDEMRNTNFITLFWQNYFIGVAELLQNGVLKVKRLMQETSQ